jgi:tetratricopeptide (TPR) repeat protein
MHDSAEFYYNKVLKVNPRDLEAWSDLDIIYFRSQQYVKSIAACKIILSIDTSMPNKYKNISTSFLHLAQYDSSIHYLQLGLSKSTNNILFYKDLALAYKLTGSVDSAKKYQALVQKSDPSFRVY